MVSVEEMRAECVRHYVERGHTPAHADLIVPKDEAEVRRIYGCIQEEKKIGYTPPPNLFSNLSDEEAAAEWAAVFFLSKRQSACEQKFLGKTGFLIGK